MRREGTPRWVLVVIVLILVCPFCILLGGAAGALALDMFWHPAAGLVEGGEPQSPPPKDQGTNPPSASSAREALSSMVGAYSLRTDSIRNVGSFYGSPVQHDAVQAAYQGPEGEVTLVIIRTDSDEQAAQYVDVVLEWVKEQSSIRITSRNPGAASILFSTNRFDGRVWNSRNWLLAVQSANEDARRAFYEDLSYK
jgi:hypothetical protein